LVFAVLVAPAAVVVGVVPAATEEADVVAGLPAPPQKRVESLMNSLSSWL
jgi:hypothetical protein